MTPTRRDALFLLPGLATGLVALRAARALPPGGHGGVLTAHLSGPRLVLDEVQLEGRRPVRWAEFSKAILTEL